MTENELKHAVLEIAYRYGWLVYHVPQATMRNGGGKGYPDLTLARDGDVRWIELKQDRGSVTREQWEWLANLNRVGYASPNARARVIRPAHLPTLEEWLR
jgi:VRR-NUC domain-containing protein